MPFQLNETDIPSKFKRLSKLLLWEKNLTINNATFGFTEIEFYYYSKIEHQDRNKNHQDPFTHEHNEEPGKWRFHNQGLDITLKGDSGFGGILIRGIENKKPKENEAKFINGPRKVVFELMRHLNPIEKPNNKIELVDNKSNDEPEIFETFRHGLNSPQPKLEYNPEELNKYRTAHYRFIIIPTTLYSKKFQQQRQSL